MIRGSARRWIVSLAVLATVAAALPADAYKPILHERIPPDDREDLALAATTADGDLPAAIDTKSGVVRAPDPRIAPPSDHAYREPFSPTGPGSVYHPDRDTRRPEMVHYADPFSPTIAPYKRLRAFDAVGADYGLFVRDTTLSKLSIGGDAKPGDDVFFGDLSVEFESGGPVLVPSVGPGARVLRAHVASPGGPGAPVDLWHDGADNWFVRPGGAKAERRLILELAIPRATFGGDFSMAPWDRLPEVARLPPSAARAVETVAKAIGISRAMTATDVVRRMVAYFRAFAPSDDPPRGYGDLYLDLALSQKGVCRHRAFAFLVTALGMGIPTRMVMNEAHAWVEVQSERLWQRIDLGGAAGDIDASDDGRPSHAPPSDPFEWPPAAEASGGRETVMRSGERAAQSPGTGAGRSRSPTGTPGAAGAASGDVEPGAPVPPGSLPATTRAAGTEPDDGAGDPPKDPADERPEARVLVRAADAETHRGEPLRLRGLVQADGIECSHLRVDVALSPPGSSTKVPVGSLTTDAKGEFEGAIFVPRSVPVGEYGVIVSTPGDARCGAGRN